MNKKISLPLLAFFGLTSSISYDSYNKNFDFQFIGKAIAGCGLPHVYATSASPVAGNCSPNKKIETFSGSAKSYIEQFETDIIDAGESVRESMEANASAEIDVLTNGNQEVIETMNKLTNTELKDTLNLERSLLDAKMNYLSEIAERELRAKKAKVALDDTEEEILFLSNKLSQVSEATSNSNSTVHVQSIINDLEIKYDNNESFVIPVRIKAAESKMSSATGEQCPEYDPNVHVDWNSSKGECFYAHKAYPGSKLKRYFEECSKIKRETILATKKDSIRSSVSKVTRAKQGAAIQVINSESAMSQRVARQKMVSCNPKEFDYELCKTKNKNVYIDKVVKNEIIPNGDISAANYFMPTDVGSIDGLIEITEEEKKSIQYSSSLDAGEEALSDNTAPIINTYRTSNQYLAAKDFVDNIVNKEIVANQDLYTRKTTNNLLFQSKFLSRAASLSLAENSLTKPIENRVGKNLSEALESGEELSPDSMIKEDVNGAGILDELLHSVNKDYEKLVIGVGETGKLENLYDMSEAQSEEWQLQALVKQNELAMEEYLQNERIEILLASILSNMVNSKENIEYLELLRNR